MAILRRKLNGQFRKAVVRVGDIATHDKGTTLLGITANKGYKVIATSLSLSKSDDFKNVCERPNHFIIINDFGERMVQYVPQMQPFMKTSASIFGAWAVSSVNKRR